MIGIYSITNTKNGRIYIGASEDIDRRWNEHRTYLRRGKHSNPQLQQDWNQQQEKDFDFAVIHTCQAEELTTLELQTIITMQRVCDVYNKYESNPEAADEARAQMSQEDWRSGAPAQEVAQLLKISARTIRRMIERGSVNAYKIDSTAKSVYRIPRAEVERLLAERENTRNQPGRK